MIQYVTIAVRRMPEVLEKLSHLTDVVLIQSREFFDFFRSLAVMGKSMKRRANTASRVHPRAAVHSHFEGRHACDIGLESERLQVEHQLHMLIERVRNAEGGTGQRARSH